MCGTALSRATRKTLNITILQYFHFANELYWRTTQYWNLNWCLNFNIFFTKGKVTIAYLYTSIIVNRNHFLI
jgi:hypothetical protein